MVDIEGKLQLEYKTKLLESAPLPIKSSSPSNKWVFLPDHGAMHTSRHKLDFIHLHDSDCLDWSAKSLD